MGKIIGVVSLKGGVGVSSISAGIAKWMSKESNLCLVDCKYNGSLDIILNLQDSALFGFDDMCRGKNLSEVSTQGTNFCFCSAPFEKELDCSEAYRRIKESEYDLTVLDQPEDPGICDTAVIVTTLEASSVRCVEKLSWELQTKGISTVLLINRFGEFKNEISAERVVDLTHTRLIGAVPYEACMPEGTRSEEVENALCNVAKRISGQDVPIFEGSKKRSKYKKMLGLK